MKNRAERRAEKRRQNREARKARISTKLIANPRLVRWH